MGQKWDQYRTKNDQKEPKKDQMRPKRNQNDQTGTKSVYCYKIK